MYCKKCGAQYEDNAKFCGKCGIRLSQNSEMPSKSAQQMQQKTVKSPMSTVMKKDKKRYLNSMKLAVGAFLILIHNTLSGVICFYLVEWDIFDRFESYDGIGMVLGHYDSDSWSQVVCALIIAVIGLLLVLSAIKGLFHNDEEDDKNKPFPAI